MGITQAHDDPLSMLNAFGVRVLWVHDLDMEVLLIDEKRLVLADADLSRHDVAGRLIELLLAEPRGA